MNCKSVQTYLSAYLDGELNGMESLEVREHLSTCADCRGEEQQLKTLKHMLRGLPMYAPSEDFEERLVRNVVKAPERRSRFRFSLGCDWRLVTGFAATAAAVTFAVLQISIRPAQQAPTNVAVDGLALEIGRDQMFLAGNDPLSGSKFAVPTSYGQR